MGRTRILTALIGCIAWAAISTPAHAAPVLTLLPTDGLVSGAPGTSVRWGFDLFADAYYVAINSVTVVGETSPLGGTGPGFVGYIQLLAGGLGNGVTAPGTHWIQPLNLGSPTMVLGEYQIDPSVPVGAYNTGFFLIGYDEFNDDPNTCGDCYVGSGTLMPSFAIDVVAASSSGVPEPGTGLLLFAGVVASWIVRKRIA